MLGANGFEAPIIIDPTKPEVHERVLGEYFVTEPLLVEAIMCFREAIVKGVITEPTQMMVVTEYYPPEITVP